MKLATGGRHLRAALVSLEGVLDRVLDDGGPFPVVKSHSTNFTCVLGTHRVPFPQL